MLKQKDLNEKDLQEENLDEIFKRFDEEMRVTFACESQSMKKENQTNLSYEKEIEIREDAKKIFDFFALIAPEHLQEGFHHAIHIKAIERKRDGSHWSQGFNIFQLNEESLNQFTEFLLDKERKNQKCCIYYSCYEYDFHKKIKHTRVNRNREKYECFGKPGQIVKENVVGTQYLTLDFDNYYKKDTEKIYQMLLTHGIETILIQSGHGQQMVFLLDEYSTDKSLLNTLVDEMSQAGFVIDESCTDITRVFRTPYTWNNKCYDLTKYMHYQRPERTSIEHSTNKRYSFETIIQTIQNMDGSSIPTIVPTAKSKSKNKKSEDVKKTTAKVASKKKKEVTEEMKTEHYYEELYSEINYQTLPEAFKNILRGAGVGVRNKSLLFLVPSLKNYHQLSLTESQNLLKKWNRECEESYPDEFIAQEVERLWNYEFKALYGRYDSDMENSFGKLRIVEDYVEIDAEVIINDSLFESLKELKRSALMIYVTMKILEKETGRYEFSKEEIAERMEIDISTFNKSDKTLINTKLCNKKNGMYSINTLNSKKTFTRVPTATLELLLMKKVSKFELAFYLYMRWQLWSSTEKVLFISRKNIADTIGCSETNISKISDALHEKKFILKTTKKEGIKWKVNYKIIK